MAKRPKTPSQFQRTLLCRECCGPLLTPEETRDGLCDRCCGDDLFAEQPPVPPRIEIPLEKPSISIRQYWLEIERPAGDLPPETANVGKWIIFVDAWHVDVLWERICQATVAGQLGTRSKVATAKANKSASKKKPRAIMVYSYNADDVEDVMRIRSVLRELGIVEKIPYKEESRKGHGTATGELGVSRYYC